MQTIRQPRSRQRVVIGLLVGVAYGALTARWLIHAGMWTAGGDFSYPWFAARVLLHGGDPYRVMQTSSGLPWGRNFFYPLPAALIAIPFAGLEVRWAGAFFVGVGCGLLAFAVTREAWWRLLMLASAPAMAAVTSVQWSPLLVATALVVPLLGILVAKPTVGLALVSMQSSRRAVGWAVAGGALLLLVSTLVLPTWPVEWLQGLRTNPSSAQYHVPILSIWAAPVALAAVSWRDPKARLLLVMACVPQNGFFYDQLALLLIPASRISLTAACLLSLGAATLAHTAIGADMAPPVAVSATWWPYVMVGMYWPALWFVLSPRIAEVSMRVWIRRNWIGVLLVTAVILIQAYMLLHSGGYDPRIPPRP